MTLQILIADKIRDFSILNNVDEPAFLMLIKDASKFFSVKDRYCIDIAYDFQILILGTEFNSIEFLMKYRKETACNILVFKKYYEKTKLTILKFLIDLAEFKTNYIKSLISFS